MDGVRESEAATFPFPAAFWICRMPENGMGIIVCFGPGGCIPLQAEMLALNGMERPFFNAGKRNGGGIRIDTP